MNERRCVKLMRISNEALQYALENNIINSDLISQAYEMKKREEMLALHTNSIWEKDGKWYTHVGKGRGNRKQVRRSSREKLEDFLFDYYEQLTREQKIDEIFETWVCRKYYEYSEITKQSYDHYWNDYRRFFKNNPAAQEIRGLPFHEITEDDLDVLIRKTIANMKLTRKTYSSMKTVLIGIFKFAKRAKLTEVSITHFISDMDISKKAFTQRNRDKEKEIFTQDETATITDFLRKRGTIRDLALLLCFETGMRIGEIATLKPEDIRKNYIRVCRTEVKYLDETTGKNFATVQEMPKTEAGYRDVFISKQTQETVEAIMKIAGDNEYLFMYGGQRIKEHAHRKHLYSVCDAVGISHKSPHKIRKTYGTMLIDGGVDESIIMEQMGHKDIMTTKKYYYFSNKSDEKKYEQIEKAVSI